MFTMTGILNERELKDYAKKMIENSDQFALNDLFGNCKSVEEVNEVAYDFLKDDMEMMVNDWMADHAEEMEDLIIDGGAYYDETLECWCMNAHDSEKEYTLTEDGHGNVSIN